MTDNTEDTNANWQCLHTCPQQKPGREHTGCGRKRHKWDNPFNYCPGWRCDWVSSTECHPPAINYPHSDLLVGRGHWVVNEFIANCSQGVKIDWCLCRWESEQWVFSLNHGLTGTKTEQESILVGHVPPACRPYPVVSHVSGGVSTHPHEHNHRCGHAHPLDIHTA